MVREENCDTVSLADEAGRCEDLDELSELICSKLVTRREQWAHKVLEIIGELGMKQSHFAQAIGVERMTVSKWCNAEAIPRNREIFLRIGLVAGYSVEQMNRLLWRYGGYGGLYSKNMEDCVCIYVTTHHCGKGALDKYREILGRIRTEIVGKEEADLSTTKFDEKLSDVKDDDELERFIQENRDVFATAYHKFYASVIAFVEANYNYEYRNIHAMAKINGWSSSLTQSIYAIKNHTWLPVRSMIISLGLHLNMTHQQIDKLLDLAHMEPLCARNILECVIIYVLEYAWANDKANPDSLEYVEDFSQNYTRQILGELDIPEIKPFISELIQPDYER